MSIFFVVIIIVCVCVFGASVLLYSWSKDKTFSLTFMVSVIVILSIVGIGTQVLFAETGTQKERLVDMARQTVSIQSNYFAEFGIYIDSKAGIAVEADEELSSYLLSDNTPGATIGSDQGLVATTFTKKIDNDLISVGFLIDDGEAVKVSCRGIDECPSADDLND